VFEWACELGVMHIPWPATVRVPRGSLALLAHSMTGYRGA